MARINKKQLLKTKKNQFNYYQKHVELPDEDSENETDEQTNTGHNKSEDKFSLLSNKKKLLWLKAAMIVNRNGLTNSLVGKIFLSRRPIQ
ncbi:hypothetical protein Mgra_00007532 [Meloidogyne graminicola]|uniref:Uncharacterized protein n=1 Tax=Meloidogyne graminicola TaxID=189291 RepID=A0A8S9ZI78_9BILA|nr:hypothetical protein Mgra_00007532 [Meloidogyne graminicola]